MGENESAAVIDVKSTDITDPQPVKVNPLTRWVMTAARKMKRTNQPAAPMVYEQTAPAPTITEPNEAQEKSFSTNGKVE
jgi:hypothetical protein